MGSFAVNSMYQAPNVKNVAVQTIAEILRHPGHEFKKGVTAASGMPHINVGDILGVITATGKYRRYTKVLAQQTRVTGDTTLILKDGLGNPVESPFVVGEIIDIGAQASKTITAVDNTNSKITIATTMGGSISVGDAIVLHTADGSEVAAGVAARPLNTAFFDPSNLNLNYLLDSDFLLDVIFQGIVAKSALRGYGAGVITDLSIQVLPAPLDSVIIR